MLGGLLPPELVKLLADPAAAKAQITAFVKAADELIAASDAVSNYSFESGVDHASVMTRLTIATNVFRIERAKLPALP